MITFVLIVAAASVVLVSAQMSCFLSREAAKRGETSQPQMAPVKATC